MFRPTLARAFAATQRTPLARMTLIGRLGMEPELVNTSTGRELVRYAVASDSGPPENRTVNWFRVAAFPEGKAKDYLLQLPKGALVHIDADARMNTYEDEDGKKAQNLSLYQRSITVISRPRNAQYETDAAAQEGAVDAAQAPQAS